MKIMTFFCPKNIAIFYDFCNKKMPEKSGKINHKSAIINQKFYDKKLAILGTNTRPYNFLVFT